jgi:hypothetical protein
MFFCLPPPTFTIIISTFYSSVEWRFATWFCLLLRLLIQPSFSSMALDHLALYHPPYIFQIFSGGLKSSNRNSTWCINIGFIAERLGSVATESLSALLLQPHQSAHLVWRGLKRKGSWRSHLTTISINFSRDKNQKLPEYKWEVNLLC